VTSSSSPVRVRFAPSPTGSVHIGNLRTALFNWLFARHHGGAFLVRIEDTDLMRSHAEFTQVIFDTLAWCQLMPDEPVLFQSQRREIYTQWIDELVRRGALYPCYCTQEEMRDRARGVTDTGDAYYVYDGRCRTLTEKLDKPFVLRVKVPRDRAEVVVPDLIHGEMRFPLAAIDDFIVVRSDGSPMYNFTVVIDDALMNISHVMRGDDHIINTPRQILLYEAAGLKIPFFAHMPLILGADGTKLSKRDAAVAVSDYRHNGFLAEALCNYLVRLGWSSGDREIISRQELVTLFSLDQIGVKGAQFDPTKLLWMNSVYLKELDPVIIFERIEKDIDLEFRAKVGGLSYEQVIALIGLYRSRAKTLVELCHQLVQLAVRPQVTREQSTAITDVQRLFIQSLSDWLASTSPITVDLIKQRITEYTALHNMSFADGAGPIRLALTGSFVAPGVADLIMCLGREESLARLKNL